MEGSAARTLRTHDMVPRVNASSHPASSSSSKRPAPGPMVWTRMLSAGQRRATSAKPSSIDDASVMSTETPKASGCAGGQQGLHRLVEGLRGPGP